jgi:hypothetical protein
VALRASRALPSFSPVTQATLVAVGESTLVSISIGLAIALAGGLFLAGTTWGRLMTQLKAMEQTPEIQRRIKYLDGQIRDYTLAGVDAAYQQRLEREATEGAAAEQQAREAALAEVTASWLETYATNPTRFDECAEELPTLHESIVINGVQRMCWTVVC